MKRTPLSLTLVLALAVCHLAKAQTSAESTKDAKPTDPAKKIAGAPATSPLTQKPLPTDPEERFKAVFSNATLSGRWAPLNDGALGEERGGDKYNILSAVKGEGDTWIISAKMKYGDREFVMPIPVKMKFVGDVAILTVDNLAIPNGGTYTARLIIFERTYSGSWKGQRSGGMLYGTITNEE